MIAQVEILWRDPAGSVRKKVMPWRKPQTNQHLAEWIEEYLSLIEEGYKPNGFEQAPRPHCARVIQLGRVVAEWRPKLLSPRFSAESLVTADERPGPGGIPAAVPSAPCSERLEVPTHPGPRAQAIQPDPAAIPRTSSDSDQPPSPRGDVGVGDSPA